MENNLTLVDVIDGDNLYHRNFFQFQDYHNGAIYGFINSLRRIVNTYPPHTLVVCWGDSRRKLWRRDLYPGYKSHRTNDGKDEKFFTQWPVLIKLLTAMSIPQLFKDKFEADDLIASLSKIEEASDDGVSYYKLGWLIFSNDKDFLQLVRDPKEKLDSFVRVVKDQKVRRANTFIEFSEEDVIKKMGVAAEHVPLLLALCGDKSDDIPGVNGIGPKTALLVLKLADFQLNKILSGKLPESKGLSHKKIEKIFINRDDIQLSYQLSNLLSPPIDPGLCLNDIVISEFDLETIQEILSEWQLTRHLDKIKTIVSSIYKVKTE